MVAQMRLNLSTKDIEFYDEMPEFELDSSEIFNVNNGLVYALSCLNVVRADFVKVLFENFRFC